MLYYYYIIWYLHYLTLTTFYNGYILLNSPNRSLLKLVNDEDDEKTYNLTQSPYYTDIEMIELLHNQTTFSVISLNCQSIASKFDEFQYFMNYLLTHNCHIAVINLQETWQSHDTYYNDFTLPGYNMYFSLLFALLMVD